MAVRENEPLRSGLAASATILALTIISAAPVLAAPDRNIDCAEASAATLEVAVAEFSTSRAVNSEDSIKLLGPGFDLMSRERIADESDESEQSEQAAEDGTETEPKREITVPPETGPLTFKRQMYRRDI